jgi:acyl carrier protein
MRRDNSNEVLKLVREEFAKDIDRDFGDQEDFQHDLKLASDDLTAIALEIEKKLGIKIDRRLYRTVNTIAEYVQLIQRHL